MPAARKSAEEQYQLIMECRTSGLSDYQWCTEHAINPGTFYNWVKRLKRKACYDIPEPIGRLDRSPAQKQEVVKVEIASEVACQNAPTFEPNALEEPMRSVPAIAAPIMLEIRGASISIQNTVDPKILNQLLQTIEGLLC